MKMATAPARAPSPAFSDGPFERLYARSGQWFVELLYAFAWLTVLVLTAFNTAVICLFFDASWDHTLDIVGRWEVAMFVALVTATCVAYPRHLPARAWLRGARGTDATVKAWASLVPGLMPVVRIFIAAILIFSIPVELYMGSRLDLDTEQVLTLVLFIAVMTVGGALLVYLFLEQLFWPVAKDMATELPGDFEPPRTVSVSGKLLGLMIGINVFTAMLVAAFSQASLARETQMGLAVFVSLSLPLAVAPAAARRRAAHE